MPRTALACPQDTEAPVGAIYAESIRPPRFGKPGRNVTSRQQFLHILEGVAPSNRFRRFFRNHAAGRQGAPDAQCLFSLLTHQGPFYLPGTDAEKQVACLREFGGMAQDFACKSVPCSNAHAGKERASTGEICSGGYIFPRAMKRSVLSGLGGIFAGSAFRGIPGEL